MPSSNSYYGPPGGRGDGRWGGRSPQQSRQHQNRREGDNRYHRQSSSFHQGSHHRSNNSDWNNNQNQDSSRKINRNEGRSFREGNYNSRNRDGYSKFNNNCSNNDYGNNDGRHEAWDNNSNRKRRIAESIAHSPSPFTYQSKNDDKVQPLPPASVGLSSPPLIESESKRKTEELQAMETKTTTKPASSSSTAAAVAEDENDRNKEETDCSYWWKTFNGNRHEIREYLKNIMDNDKRLLKFRQLPGKISMVLFLSDELTYEGEFPYLEFPFDFTERQDRSLESTLQYIQTDMFPPTKGEYYDSDNSSMDRGNDMMAQVYGGCGKKFDQLECEEFAKALLYCLPMHAGFQVHYLWQSDLGIQKCCHCPCGRRKHLQPWRDFFHLNIHRNQPCDAGKKAPFEFLQHVTNYNDKYHIIIQHYLTKVYESYHKDGVRHIGFADRGGEEFKKTSKILSARVRKTVERLQEEVSQANQREKELREAQILLERTNQDLYKQLQEKSEVKKLLKAQKEQYLNDSNFNHYKERAHKFFDSTRNLAFLDGKEDDDKQWYKLLVSDDFDLTMQLEKWYSTFLEDGGKLSSQHAELFLEKAEGLGQIHLAGKVINGWNIHVEASSKEIAKKRIKIWDDNKKRWKKEKLQIEAIDHGGPSREFFQSVWRQMGCLAVESKTGKKVKLFPGVTKDGYIPNEDDVFETMVAPEVLPKVKAFYRAIGRMMSHCILLSKKDYGPIAVACNALPQLYQSVLLRNLTPLNPNYNSDALVDHVSLILDAKVKQNEDKSNYLLNFLGLTNLEEGNDPDQLIRKMVSDVYVEPRQIALESLREGLSIGGFLDWGCCYGLFPSTAVNRIAFAKNKITEDDLFVEPGVWRFIKFECQQYPENFDEMTEIEWSAHFDIFEETHKLFKQQLEEFFRKKVKLDENNPRSSFLSDFIWHCTGQSYIPDLSLIEDFDFKITIEFNHTEMPDGSIPVVHSCEKIIKIPDNCYNNNMEDFEDKLLKAIEHSKGRFDME